MRFVGMLICRCYIIAMELYVMSKNVRQWNVIICQLLYCIKYIRTTSAFFNFPLTRCCAFYLACFSVTVSNFSAARTTIKDTSRSLLHLLYVVDQKQFVNDWIAGNWRNCDKTNSKAACYDKFKRYHNNAIQSICNIHVVGVSSWPEDISTSAMACLGKGDEHR